MWGTKTKNSKFCEVDAPSHRPPCKNWWTCNAAKINPAQLHWYPRIEQKWIELNQNVWTSFGSGSEIHFFLDLMNCSQNHFALNTGRQDWTPSKNLSSFKALACSHPSGVRLGQTWLKWRSQLYMGSEKDGKGILNFCDHWEREELCRN